MLDSHTMICETRATPDTWCIDPARLVERISPRTRGIIAVHLYGHPADMDAINRIAGDHGLWVVEDAAEAHLARYRGRLVGGLGQVGVFSFYGNKCLTCGEGGALTLDDETTECRARIQRGQGASPSPPPGSLTSPSTRRPSVRRGTD